MPVPRQDNSHDCGMPPPTPLATPPRATPTGVFTCAFANSISAGRHLLATQQHMPVCPPPPLARHTHRHTVPPPAHGVGASGRTRPVRFVNRIAGSFTSGRVVARMLMMGRASSKHAPRPDGVCGGVCVCALPSPPPGTILAASADCEGRNTDDGWVSGLEQCCPAATWERWSHHRF